MIDSDAFDEALRLLWNNTPLEKRTIARRLCITDRELSGHMSRLNLPSRARHMERSVCRDTVKRLRESGMSCAAIGEIVGCTTSTAHRIIINEFPHLCKLPKEAKAKPPAPRPKPVQAAPKPQPVKVAWKPLPPPRNEYEAAQDAMRKAWLAMRAAERMAA